MMRLREIFLQLAKYNTARAIRFKIIDRARSRLLARPLYAILAARDERIFFGRRYMKIDFNDDAFVSAYDNCPLWSSRFVYTALDKIVMIRSA